MEKINIAIIGLGHVFDYQIRALYSINELNLVAVSDIDINKKNKISKNIKFYKNYKEMILNEKIDVVLISVPNKLHFEVAKYCLENNLNILLEKPATLKIEDFQKLINVSKQKNLVFVVAFHAMFAKDLIWFFDYYKSFKEKTGKIISFYCGFFDPYIVNNKLKEGANSLLGSWIDSGINALSVISKLIDYKSLSIKESKLSYISNINPYGEVQGSVMLNFDSYYEGIIDTNWTLNLNCKKTHLRFENQKIEIVLNHSKQNVVKIENGKKKILASFGGERLVNHYIGVFKDYVVHYKNKTTNLDLAYKLHKILLDAHSKNKVEGCY